MKKVIQSHSFDSAKNGSKVVAVGLGVSALSTFAMAAPADPQWYTDLNLALVAILAMAGTVLGSVITIKLVPIAWDKIKPILSR